MILADNYQPRQAPNMAGVDKYLHPQKNNTLSNGRKIDKLSFKEIGSDWLTIRVVFDWNTLSSDGVHANTTVANGSY